jgi:hypothetical protein
MVILPRPVGTNMKHPFLSANIDGEFMICFKVTAVVLGDGSVYAKRQTPRRANAIFAKANSKAPLTRESHHNLCCCAVEAK